MLREQISEQERDKVAVMNWFARCEIAPTAVNPLYHRLEAIEAQFQLNAATTLVLDIEWYALLLHQACAQPYLLSNKYNPSIWHYLNTTTSTALKQVRAI